MPTATPSANRAIARVLVVDDQPDVREALQRFLGGHACLARLSPPRPAPLSLASLHDAR